MYFPEILTNYILNNKLQRRIPSAFLANFGLSQSNFTVYLFIFFFHIKKKKHENHVIIHLFICFISVIKYGIDLE